MLWLDAGVASFLSSLQNKPLQACSPCLQAQLINKALESMRNILAMLAHCHKSLTFDTNQVHVLMLSSTFTVLLYLKSSVRQHWLRDSSSPRGMDMFCVGRAYSSGCRNIACHSLHVVHVWIWCLPKRRLAALLGLHGLIWSMIASSVPWIASLYFALILYEPYFRNECTFFMWDLPHSLTQFT